MPQPCDPDRDALPALAAPRARGVAFCALTSLAVVGGVWFGVDFLPRQPNPDHNPRGFVSAFGAWDGVQYARIARSGYSYDPHRRSNVVFFPAYPLLGRAVMLLSGLRAEAALLVVSHVSLVGAFVTMAAYLDGRAAPASRSAGEYALLAMGLWPTTFFFRMAYTESLFLLVLLVALYGMQRRWPCAAIALVVGLATAVRAPGVALLPCFAVHLWRESPGAGRFAARAVVLLPLALWGLAAFMAWQHATFGDALAFTKAQSHWTVRPAALPGDELRALVTLEPLWSVYVPSSEAYWARDEPVANPLFSLQFANPIYFIVAAGLVALGACRGWLDEREWLLAALLLAVAYVAHGHRGVMMGQARYAAAVFPVYIVLGELACHLRPSVSAGLFATGGALLGIYSALFVAWYRMI